MLPKTKLGKQMYRKLNVYAGAEASASGAEAVRTGACNAGECLVAALVQHLGTGRRKTSVARVFLRPGNGPITINGRPFENYFTTETARAMVRQPLLAPKQRTNSTFSFSPTAAGIAGQAGAAARIARALVEFNTELRGR